MIQRDQSSHSARFPLRPEHGNGMETEAGGAAAYARPGSKGSRPSGQRADKCWGSAGLLFLSIACELAPGSLPGAPRRRRYAQQLGDPHVIWPLSDWRRTVWAEHGMAIAVGGSANWCFLCLGVPLQPGVVCPARSTLSISEDLVADAFQICMHSVWMA